MVGTLHRRIGRAVGLGAVALGTAKCLKESHRDKAARIGQGRVAGFVPVLVMLATNDVKKVAAGETQFLGRLGIVVVKRADDLLALVSKAGRSAWQGCEQSAAANLLRGDNGNGRLGGDRNVGSSLLLSLY